MPRAYQSPCSGTHWADQWAQMPNLASRNQSGVWCCASSDAHVGSNGPAAVGAADGLTWTGTSAHPTAARPTPTANPTTRLTRLIRSLRR